MIEDYVICYQSSVEDLMKEVETYLVKDYHLYGHPFTDQAHIFQALIKYPELPAAYVGE